MDYKGLDGTKETAPCTMYQYEDFYNKGEV